MSPHDRREAVAELAEGAILRLAQLARIAGRGVLLQTATAMVRALGAPAEVERSAGWTLVALAELRAMDDGDVMDNQIWLVTAHALARMIVPIPEPKAKAKATKRSKRTARRART